MDDIIIQNKAGIQNPDPSIPFLGEKFGWNSLSPNDGIVIF